VVLFLGLIGGGTLLGGLSLSIALAGSSPGLSKGMFHTGFWLGGTLALTSLLMLWASKVSKPRFRELMLDSVTWRGDEQVLDIGCGRGIMLVGAAKRLTSGKAHGLDIWKKERAGNDAAITMANAEAEGVAGKIALHTADARQLPFADGMFDVVLSSWALHEMSDAGDRERAVREAARVLKAGGRIVLADARYAEEYAATLAECACDDIRIFAPHHMFMIPARTVTARKD
jgi:arsenite methyltransferase